MHAFWTGKDCGGWSDLLASFHGCKAQNSYATDLSPPSSLRSSSPRLTIDQTRENSQGEMKTLRQTGYIPAFKYPLISKGYLRIFGIWQNGKQDGVNEIVCVCVCVWEVKKEKQKVKYSWG